LRSNFIVTRYVSRAEYYYINACFKYALCAKTYQNLLVNYLAGFVSLYIRRVYSQFSIFPDIFAVVILYGVTSLRYCGALGAIRYGECRFHYCISRSVVILKQLSLPDAPQMMTIFVSQRARCDSRVSEINFIARGYRFSSQNRYSKSL